MSLQYREQKIHNKGETYKPQNTTPPLRKHTQRKKREEERNKRSLWCEEQAGNGVYRAAWCTMHALEREKGKKKNKNLYKCIGSDAA